MGSQNHMATEAPLAKTLFYITGASLLTWLLCQILNLLANFDVIMYLSNL